MVENNCFPSLFHFKGTREGVDDGTVLVSPKKKRRRVEWNANEWMSDDEEVDHSIYHLAYEKKIWPCGRNIKIL